MLTDAQISQFHAQGYLIVEDVIDRRLLEDVKAEYAALMDRLYAAWFAGGDVTTAPEGLDFWSKLEIAREAGLEWFQPMDISLPHENITEDTPFHCGPAVFDLLTHDPVLDRVESLLGGELTSTPIQHVRIKPPQRKVPKGEMRAHIGTTSWHQDRGVGLPEADETEMVTVWIAANDATVDNGCLQVMPSPLPKMLPHCPQGQTSIAPRLLDTSDAVHAEVSAGSIIMIHPLTPHCAGPNMTNGHRWSFDIRYNVTGQPTGRAQFPEFVARSRKDPLSVLRDWQTWQEMWIAARKTAATSEHIPQHRWQADSPACA